MLSLETGLSKDVVANICDQTGGAGRAFVWQMSRRRSLGAGEITKTPNTSTHQMKSFFNVLKILIQPNLLVQNECTECSRSAVSLSIFIVMLCSCALVVLFLLGWRFVFPGNLFHRFHDTAVQRMVAFGVYIVSRCLSSKGSRVRLWKVKSIQGVQGAKIFLANFQVDFDRCSCRPWGYSYVIGPHDYVTGLTDHDLLQ